ncbi:hypothetical protein [Paraburkholderia youngii]|uniref:hypothetical protein n=1 Tax=Paraburkholderia youngii TaxID=2782701 RepID=UPI003D25A03E
MRVFTSDDLVVALRPPARRLFAIDGYQGTGKTTLAVEISGRLGVPCVHLDEYLNKQKGGFVKFLRYSELSSVLRQRPLIVEGVCVLAVLKNLGMTPDVLVYVQSKEPSASTPRGRGLLASEVRTYHRSCKPEAVADVIYLGFPANRQQGEPMKPESHEIDIAFINAKTRLCIALIAGGMLSLVVGLIVLLYGAAGQDEAIISAAGTEIHARGIGAVIMVTSILWAFFAYKSRPIYSRKREVSEVRDPKTGHTEWVERESSTQLGARPPDDD